MISFIKTVLQENIENIQRTVVIARMTLKKKHTNSDLGAVWEIMRPVMYILMFYVALSSGFKSASNIEGMVCSYFIWLATGIVAWFYIQDFLVGGANCFLANKTLFAKNKYPVTTIPMISVIANLRIHLIMVGLLICMALISGTKPSIYWLQLPICLAMIILFIFMWSFMFGLMNIMSPDILDFIKTIKPAFFWLSGILFNIRGRGSILFKLNPICFLVENYRNALCFDTWFWEDRTALLCFFGIIFIMLMITWLLYRKIGSLLAELV